LRNGLNGRLRETHRKQRGYDYAFHSLNPVVR
jgi:hypothetical protein